MRRSQWTQAIVVCSILATGSAFADAGKWYDTIALSGYVQTSYQANLNHPQNTSGVKQDTTGRQFDTDSNGFSLNRVLLQIAKPVGDSDHYGFTVRLAAGKDAAALNTASGEGSSKSLSLQEAYVTYAVPALTRLSFIAGKFVTPEGFEGVDTVSNPNYSEGLLFTYAEPISHTGLKANYVFNDKVNTTVGVVNGWDVTTDNNTAKTLLWQVATAPMKGLSWSFQGLYGKELADPSHSSRLSLDTVASYTISKLTVAAQGNWGQQSNDPNTSAGQGTTHWTGAGLWASFAETEKCTTSVRFEVLGDENLANRFGATAFPLTGTTNQTVKEVTLTQKHMFTSNLGARAEFRHDWSNQPYFTKTDGSSVRNQNTISTDLFVTF